MKAMGELSSKRVWSSTHSLGISLAWSMEFSAASIFLPSLRQGPAQWLHPS